MTALVTSINELSAAVPWALWRATWQGGLALLLVFALCRTVQRIPASAQCWLWRLAYLKLLIAGLWVVPVELRLLPPLEAATSIPFAADETRTAVPVRVASDVLIVESFSATPNIASRADVSGRPANETLQAVRRLSGAGWLLIIWVVGATLMLANLLRHGIRARRMVSTLTPVLSGPAAERLIEHRRRMRIARAPELRTSQDVRCPFLAGVRRPVIVLPGAMVDSGATEELDAVLTHELAHIRRRDLVWNWLPALAEAAFFFHPLVWLARREWRIAQEIATDEMAISTSRLDVTCYARALVNLIARSPHTTISPHFAVPLSEACTQLARRLIAMQTFRPLTFRRRVTIAATVLALAPLGLVPWKVTAQESPTASQVAATADNQVVAAEPIRSAPADEAARNAPQEDKAMPARTIAIHVVDRAGQPVEGAQVFRNHVYRPDGGKRTRIENENYVTNAAGKTTVALSGTSVDLRLWVRKENIIPLHAMWARAFQSDGDQIPAEFTFVLEPGTTIGGIVKNEGGEPIEGVRVEVRDMTAQRYYSPNPKDAGQRPLRAVELAYGDDAVVTDADGRWMLGNVPADEILIRDDDPFAYIAVKVVVRLSHPDYAGDSAWGGLQQQQGIAHESLRDQTATIVMSRGHTLSGRVTDADGNPLRQALMILSDDDPFTDREPQTVRTDANGEYRFNHLAGPPRLLTVLADGHPMEIKRAPVDHLSRIDVALKHGRAIAVLFVDGTGQPIPDVGVAILEWNRMRFLEVQFAGSLAGQIPRRADADGKYEWTAAPGDRLLCNFSKPGYQTVRNYSLTPSEHIHTVTLGPNPALND